MWYFVITLYLSPFLLGIVVSSVFIFYFTLLYFILLTYHAAQLVGS